MTAIIAVGLTFVILCAEIDLSVAAIANATGIVVAYFTLQESYVSIANMPLPGALAILLALVTCFALGVVNAVGLTVIGIPSFIMTLAMMQIAAGVSALLVRGQIAYKVPDLVATLGSQLDRRHPLDRHRRGGDAPHRRISCSPTRASAATCTWSAATARRPNIPASMSSSSSAP